MVRRKKLMYFQQGREAAVPDCAKAAISKKNHNYCLDTATECRSHGEAIPVP